LTTPLRQIYRCLDAFIGRINVFGNFFGDGFDDIFEFRLVLVR